MSHSVKFVVALFCGCNISAQPRGVVAVFRYLDKQSFVFGEKSFIWTIYASLFGFSLLMSACMKVKFEFPSCHFLIKYITDNLFSDLYYHFNLFFISPLHPSRW
jgi:hypothetical protein